MLGDLPQLYTQCLGPREPIVVELDLQGVLNSDTISPKITFGEHSPDVGVLGKPTVAVTVAEPSGDETSEE